MHMSSSDNTCSLFTVSKVCACIDTYWFVQGLIEMYYIPIHEYGTLVLPCLTPMNDYVYSCETWLCVATSGHCEAMSWPCTDTMYLKLVEPEHCGYWSGSKLELICVLMVISSCTGHQLQWYRNHTLPFFILNLKYAAVNPSQPGRQAWCSHTVKTQPHMVEITVV